MTSGPTSRPSRSRLPRELLAELFRSDALAGLLELDGELPESHLHRALREPADDFLSRPGKAFRSRLVEITWTMVEPVQPLPPALTAIVELLHAGSLIVDDIQDGSTHRRGEPALHRRFGTPLALNTGNWLYFWPFQLLEGAGLPPERELDLQRRIARTLSRGHFGQALDLACFVPEMPQADLPSVSRAIQALKTGQLMRFAACLGPVAAGAPPAVVEAFGRSGMQLGLGLQMLDDLGSLDEHGDPTKRFEDLRLGRVTWPWARLSAQLSAPAFAELQRAAAQVCRGEQEADALARRMRESLAGNERAEARAILEKGLDALAGGTGATTDLSPLIAEIRRLEVSYG